MIKTNLVMMKKLLIILVLATGFTACKSNDNNACGTQTCTASFAYFGVTFTDSEGKPTAIKDVKLFNVRTGKTFSPPFSPPAIDFVAGFVLVALMKTRASFLQKAMMCR